MTQKQASKGCLTCGKTIMGRADKKFCDDSCRNAYNNTLNSDSNNYVRNTLNILRKNRRILEEVLANKETIVISLEKLIQKGYNKKYMTETLTTQKGEVYYYTFEYGYKLVDEGKTALIVKQNFGKK